MGIWRSQNAFIGGEVSPRLYGRVDIASYKNSAAKLQNFLIYPHGGITARPGTKYAWTVKNSAQEVRLIPFDVSQDVSYIIEVGAGYFRFGRYGSLIEIGSYPTWDSVTTYAAGDKIVYNGYNYYSLQDNNTNHTPPNPQLFEMSWWWSLESSPLAPWSSGTTYAHGDQVSKGGVNYYSLQDNNLNKDPAVETAYWYAMPGDIFEIPNDYTQDDLASLTYCQSVDVLWLFHPSYEVMRLERYGDADWLFIPEVFLDGPYGTINYTTTTLVASAGTGTVTITASATTGINGGDGFKSTDVGRHVRIYGASAWAWGEITGYTSSTVVTALVVGGTMPVTPTTSWKLGRYSDTTGYPTIGTLHDARLIVCRDADIDLSRTDILADYGVSETTEASDACNFKMLSNQTNPIRWITSSRGGLAVGTLSGEFLMTGGSSDAAISPSSISSKQHTSIGGKYQQALSADAATLFVARTGKALHEFAYVYEDDGYQAPNLSLLAEHLFRNETIVRADYQRASSIIWCVRSDGKLVGLTYKRKEQIVGWHQHDTNGLFLDVVCVNEGERDVPYFIVSRTVNGSTVKMVEFLSDDFITGDLSDSYYVDCGIQYSGVATTTITGLDHLEGDDVSVLADGKVVADRTVSGGSITLPYSAEKVSAGLSYYSDMQTLPIEEPGIQDGATLGRMKTASKIILKLDQSYGCSLGPDVDNLVPVIFNENQVYGEAPAPFTGDKMQMLGGGYGTDKRVYVRRDKPLPLTIIALMVEWEVTQR